MLVLILKTEQITFFAQKVINLKESRNILTANFNEKGETIKEALKTKNEHTS